MPRVSFRSVSKTYGDTQVLAPVDLDFPGGVLAILGPNGSGKSTLLKRALDLVPGGGAVMFDGVPFRKMGNPRRLVGVSLGPSVLNPLDTPKRLLTTTAIAAGCSKRRVQEVLEETQSAAFQRQRIRSLSAGMRQRVALALALIADPPTLLLDEPESGLDEESCRWLGNVISQCQAQGRTVVVGTHQPQSLSIEPEHVIKLEGGRVRASTSPDLSEHVLVGCASESELRHFLNSAPGLIVQWHDPDARTARIESSASEAAAAALQVGVTLTQLTPLAWFDE